MDKKLEFRLGEVFSDGLDVFLVAKNGSSNPVFLRGEQQKDYFDFTNLEELREEELGILSQEGYQVGKVDLTTREIKIPGDRSVEMRVPKYFEDRYSLSQ